MDFQGVVDALYSPMCVVSVEKTKDGGCGEIRIVAVNKKYADNLQDAMKNVIAEIRKICNAEGCTVLLINYDEAQYSILATDYVANSVIKRVTQFKGFYDIAASWEKMIGSYPLAAHELYGRVD